MTSFESCDRSFCPCMEPCPIRHALDILGGKWKMPIWCALKKDGPTRYNELKRKIDGITNTMLASSLKEMERAGLVVRTQYPEMPVRVEYALAERSDALAPAIEILAAWGRETLLNPSD
ncbi:MAG: winged helix-turn-helix transcriptional regulator [Oscillospiraceae bacterium]|jgi:DNA-binding HxlR family transcriptional regulator